MIACCIDCRLLQPAIGPCRACPGHAVSIAEDTLRDELRERGTTRSFLRGLKWVGILFTWPISLMVLSTRDTTRRATGLVPTRLAPPATSIAARRYRGVVHPLGAAPDDGALVEETVLYRGDGVLVRQVRARPFLVELDDGAKLVVDGEVRMDLDGISRTPVRSSSSIYDELGIPTNLRGPASLGVATLRDGARVELVGEASEELRPELASYRDAGGVTVLRGRPGSLVSIATKS